MATEGKKYPTKQILFTGRWIPDEDGLKIGEENYQTLENCRYRPVNLEGVAGYTKINTTPPATYLKGRSGIQIVSAYDGESRVMIQAKNAGETAAAVLENKTAIPNRGNFESSVLHTDASGAGAGRFAAWPKGHVAYSNGKESLIYAGGEIPCNKFINYDPNGGFKYRYGEVVSNIETDNLNVATLYRVTESVDANTMLLLHLDNDVTDSSPATAHTVTNTNVTFSTTIKVFGTHAAVFNGTNAELTVPDNADFDFSGGTFSIDLRLRLDQLPATGHVAPIYFQETAGTGNDWFKLYVDENGALHLKIRAHHGGSPAYDVEINTVNAVIDALTWYHIELVESGDNWYLFVNGVQKAYVSDAGRAANYTGLVRIGYDGTDWLDGTIDEYRVSDSARHTGAFEIPIAAYGAATKRTYAYIGATRPLKGIKIYVDRFNTEAGTLNLEYWDGTNWAGVGNLTDGTAAGGIPLAQTGSITFDSTVSTAKVKVIDTYALYWYRFTVTNIRTGVQFSHITLDASFQDVKDIWDLVFRTIISFQVYDNSTYNEYTLSVAEEDFDSSNTATYAPLNSLGTSDYVVMGFEERLMGARICLVGGSVNTTSDTHLTVFYWNGTAWTDVGTIDDGTFEGNKSFAKTGIVSWNPPDDNTEFKREISSEIPLYYYKFAFSKALSADVKVDCIQGITAPRKMVGGYRFPFMFQGRPMLCNFMSGKEGNRVDYGMMYTTDVFNGEDSSAGTRGALYFGDNKDLTGAVQLYNRFGSSLYNVAIFTKDQSTFILNGYDGETWQINQLSETVGCPAPETMDSAEIGYGIAADAVRNVAMWLSYSGPIICDAAVMQHVKGNIECYFDKRDARCINFDAIEASVGWVDPDHLEYNLLIPSGTGQTTPNVWLVLDLVLKKWTQKVPHANVPSRYPRAAIRVVDTEGTQYVYGLRDNGYMMRLEHGTRWDTKSIIQRIIMADHVPTGNVWDKTKIHKVKLIGVGATEEDAGASLYHYADGSSTRTALGTLPLTGSNRHVRVTHKVDRQAWSHTIEICATTTRTTRGFQPLGLAYKYEIVREDN